MSHKILIVDDTSDWRKMLAGLIRDIFPETRVFEASSMAEAEALLNQQKFKLAVLDIRLDDSDENNVDGLVLAEHIHQKHPQIRLIIITSYANLETVQRAMQPDKTGARLVFDYVEKDKLNSELMPQISNFLKGE